MHRSLKALDIKNAPGPAVSVIITTYNEGKELHRTIASVIKNTIRLAELVVVDDGSTDGSCDAISNPMVRVVRNEVRTGIAYSRNRGTTAAVGNVYCYLDSHQRVSPGCLDRCAKYALEHKAIVCPDIRDYGLLGWRLHGATFELCPRRGFFSARWRQWFQLRRTVRVTGLRAPPYLIPASHFPSVAWCSQLRGWGASEACVAVKAFFTNTPIVHLRGPLSRHRFQNQSHFPVSWRELYRNQAIIARICFDSVTWNEHWLPFFRPHLDEATLAELASPVADQEQRAFALLKRRPDREFWSNLLKRHPPRMAPVHQFDGQEPT